MSGVPPPAKSSKLAAPSETSSAIVAEIKAEEAEGRFRLIRGDCGRKAIDYYKTVARQNGRYEHLNPSLTAPGKNFDVCVGNTDGPILAHGYSNIVTTPHGLYVQIPPTRLAMPRSSLSRGKPSAMSTLYGWISYRFAGVDINFAEPREKRAANAEKKLGFVAQQRVGPEFPRNFFYVSVNNVFIIEQKQTNIMPSSTVK